MPRVRKLWTAAAPVHAPRSVAVGRQALVLACAESDPSGQVGRVHDDPRRLERTGPRLALSGRFDAGTGRVDPRAATGESAAVVQCDPTSISNDAYQLDDGSAGTAADAGPFGEWHALTVAEGPTPTKNSALAQRTPRKRVSDGTRRKNRSGKRRQLFAERVNTLPPLDPASSRCRVLVRPGYFSAAVTSGRMSIRQPVNRAARRAFCPSRPMARLSW